jgi:hypothetical protein
MSAAAAGPLLDRLGAANLREARGVRTGNLCRQKCDRPHSASGSLSENAPIADANRNGHYLSDGYTITIYGSVGRWAVSDRLHLRWICQ